MNEKLYDLIELVRRTAVQAGNVAADAAYGVGKLAGEAIDTAKLRIHRSTLEGAVEDALTEVGKMMYATHTGTPTDSDELLAKLQEIDALKAEIDEIGAKLGQEASHIVVQAVPVCPTCGAKIQEGDAFCRECGGELT